ncbi:hypothetical protein [Nocardioides sambongensis]|uniref:hypothetical protein n=1 Tax=Nocardioides sambongensis TaxID=2589074 RepID=UPI001126F0DC|nr:hypothetical protein [Nocardioides sambongensis]
MRRRTSTVIVALLSAVLLLGCGTAPSQVERTAEDGTTAVPHDGAEGRAAPAAAPRRDGPSAAARAGLTAFTTYSWKDPSLYAWVNRLIRLATPVYASYLKETYWGATPAELSRWQQLVADKTATRTVIRSAKSSKVDAATRTVTLVANVQHRSAGDTAWRAAGSAQKYRVRVVRSGGGWRVDAID